MLKLKKKKRMKIYFWIFGQKKLRMKLTDKRNLPNVNLLFIPFRSVDRSKTN